MNKKLFIIPLIAALFLSGCNNRALDTPIDNNEETETETDTDTGEDITPGEEQTNTDYRYQTYKSGIKLLEYVGEYKEFLCIPKTIDGKKVISIASGCFKRKKVNPQRTLKLDGEEEEDEGNPSTYYIDEDVEEIENGAFDDDSTFVTPNEDMGEGWEDTSLTGDAVDGDGNVYFDTDIDETMVENGILYTYVEKVNGYYVARCLSQTEEIDIPEKFNNVKVVQIGRKSFYKNNHIKSVSFPNTITDIYPNAFEDCKLLSTLSFDSPNLSKITAGAFRNCVSLDVITLPENCAVLGGESFYGCGTISAIHIPAAMTTIALNTFLDTVVQKVYYYGNEEQWNTLITYRGRSIDQYIGLKDAEIIFFGSNEAVELDSSLDLFASLPNGTPTILKGILSGYAKTSKSRVQYVLLSELATGYTIICYNVNWRLQYDANVIGREIVATGTKSPYYGMVELNYATIEFTDDETIYNVPTKNVDWSNPATSLADNSSYFEELTATVKSVSGTFVYFEEFDSFYAFGSSSSETWVGKRIKIRGILVRYNTDYEFLYDSLGMQILE